MQKQKTVSLIFIMEAGYHLKDCSCHLTVQSFPEQENLKNKVVLLFVQTYQKMKEVPYIKMSPDNNQKLKESPYKETSHDID